MKKMDLGLNHEKTAQLKAVNSREINILQQERQSDVAIRMLSPGIRPLSSLDTCVLKLYILQTYRRLRCIDATRARVLRSYANIRIHNEFNAEIQRILKSLEDGSLSEND